MNLSDIGLDIVECQIGSLVVSGRGVLHVSAMWNNEISKSSIAFVVPLTDEVDQWVLSIVRSSEEGYVRPFRAVYEDNDPTARLVMSGEGSVYPHIFGRNNIAAIFVVNIPDFKREAIDLTSG